MGEDAWADVDAYLCQHLIPDDPVLREALAANADAGLPSIDVSPLQGKLLHLIARLMRAERILEIGTLGGYSTIWLARALGSSGRLLSLEVDPQHAKVARSNLARAGLSDRVEVRVGAALKTLPRLAAEGAGPFDLVFIDADKESIPEYFSWALRLTRPGAAILCDNIVRHGAVIEAGSGDPRVEGVRHFMDQLATESRVSATALQTVGVKGWDGLVLAIVQ